MSGKGSRECSSSEGSRSDQVVDLASCCQCGLPKNATGLNSNYPARQNCSCPSAVTVEDGATAAVSPSSPCPRCHKQRSRNPVTEHSNANILIDNCFCTQADLDEDERRGNSRENMPSTGSDAATSNTIDADQVSQLSIEEERKPSACEELSVSTQPGSARHHGVLTTGVIPMPGLRFPFSSTGPAPSQHTQPVFISIRMFKRGRLNIREQSCRIYFIVYDTSSSEVLGIVVAMEATKDGYEHQWLHGDNAPVHGKEHYNWIIPVQDGLTVYLREVDPKDCKAIITSESSRMTREQLSRQLGQSTLIRGKLCYIEISLKATNPFRETSTTITVAIASDHNGKITHTSYRTFAFKFNPRMIQRTGPAELSNCALGMPEADCELLRDNHEIIRRRIRDVGQVCCLLYRDRVLDEKDKNKLLESEEQVGELLKILPYRGDVLVKFIDALVETGKKSNKKLAKILSAEKFGDS